MSKNISKDGYCARIDSNVIKLISPGDEGVKTLSGHGGRVWSVCFSPDGRLLASGSDCGEVKVWNVGSGECVKTLSGHGGGYVVSVCFSPDGTLLESHSHEAEVKMWNVESGDCVKTVNSQECIHRLENATPLQVHGVDSYPHVLNDEKSQLEHAPFLGFSVEGKRIKQFRYRHV